MYRIGLLSLFLFTLYCNSTYAYEVIGHSTEIAHDVFLIESEPPAQHFFIGELQDFPQMYEFASNEPFLLTVQIRALPGDKESLPEFHGIVIRQKNNTVEEIARLNSGGVSWEEGYDSVSGLTYLVGETFSQEVTAGVYRIEVSTPQNLGKYVLMFGNKPQSVRYFVSLNNVSKMYLFYGTPRIFMIRSPLVYYPVGIIILIGLIVITWRWQRRRNLYA